MAWNDVNALWNELYCQLSAVISSVLAISLDFSPFVTDTAGITPVPPLPLVGDVHLGRVFRKHNARLELNRITAAPPLMPFRHNAVLGRLLFFGDIPFLRGGHR